MKHIYIHIPFCHRRCSYCDFNTYANMDDRIEAYVDALVWELEQRAEGITKTETASPSAAAIPLLRSSLKPTIFLGGGTPTMLSLEQMERVLGAANRIVPLDSAEVTTEANPGTILGGDYLRGLRDLGVNRISMGVQSLHDPLLRVLGRIHTAAEARQSFEDAQKAGFERINLDFMFGLPGQTVAQWESTLDEIVTWGAEHFSLYSLILEEGTPLHAQVTGGRVAIPDDDVTGEMYELAMARFADAGYAQYEISNWARDERSEPRTENKEQRTKNREQGTENQEPRTENSEFRVQNSEFRIENRDTGSENREPGHENSEFRIQNSEFRIQNSVLPTGACHHNLAYWLNADYLAAGAGAHGHVFPRRYFDILKIDDYINSARAGKLPTAEITELTERDLQIETMFMGLRLNIGVSYAHFRDRCGVDMRDVFGATLDELVAQGLLAQDATGVRLTARGRMLGNQVFMRFV